MSLFFVTGNPGKFKEAKKILLPLEIVQKKVELSEIQSLDAKEVISHKLNEAKKHLDEELVIEDVSFEIDALNKFPGPLIKWFLKAFSGKEIYEMCKTKNNFKARGIATLGYSNNKETKFFEGVIEGKIVLPRGESSFGWDPIFVPEGKQKTFAEMSLQEKNKISHRYKALTNFKKWRVKQ